LRWTWTWDVVVDVVVVVVVVVGSRLRVTNHTAKGIDTTQLP
jgi:hypothetical protein